MSLVYRGRNGAQRPPLSAQSGHFSDLLLLSLNRHQLAVVAQPVAKGPDPAEIPATGLLIGPQETEFSERRSAG